MARKAEFPHELISICAEKWYNGPGWGAATSHPIVKEQYLPKDISDALHEAVVRKYAEVRVKVEAGNREVRKIGREYCEAFERCGRLGLSKNDSKFYKLPDGFIEPTSWGNATPDVHLLCLDLDHASWSRKNGVDRVTLVPLENVVVDFDVAWSYNYHCGGGYSRGVHNTYSLWFDPDKQLYRFRQFQTVGVDPIPDSKRRRNWCRATKRNEFLAVCKQKFREIIADGYEYSEYKHVEYGPNLIIFRKKEIQVPVEPEAPKAEEPIAADAPSAPPSIDMLELAASTLDKPEEVPQNKTVPYKGSICFTGALETMTRADAQKLARSVGFDIHTSVTQSLKYLVMADPNSTSIKACRARAFGTKLLSESEFLSMVSLAKEKAS